VASTPRGFVLLFALFAVGCSSNGPAPADCAAGQELFRGRCVDPAQRYEPDQRVDEDNVVAYGDPLMELDLPPPPKSSVRLIVPPRTLKPGEEDQVCISWPYPKIKNTVIYAGRLYTTSGLHHSNLIAKPVNPKYGPNPYPNCNPGASDPLDRVLEGVIPDV